MQMESQPGQDVVPGEIMYRLIRQTDGSIQYRPDGPDVPPVPALHSRPPAPVGTAVAPCVKAGHCREPIIYHRPAATICEDCPGPALQPGTERAAPRSGTGALTAFGMYWKRDQIRWSGQPRLFGRQKRGPGKVDFAEQVGVYLLHDRDRIIYVGRATEKLCARLKAHTGDRMAGRWDRFSWFGMRAVGKDGLLHTPSSSWNHNVIIETMEALMIESLEPPLNRKRGDNLSGAEYLQVADPEIEHLHRTQLLAELIHTTGWSPP